jgi:hypothetical protein
MTGSNNQYMGGFQDSSMDVDTTTGMGPMASLPLWPHGIPTPYTSFDPASGLQSKRVAMHPDTQMAESPLKNMPFTSPPDTVVAESPTLPNER